MADFFEPKETPETPEPQEDVVEKITIGEEEFDPEDLQDIIGKGRMAREAEEKYNTKIDKVWPEYTKATQKLKEYEEKEKEWTEKQEQAVEQKPQEELTEEEMKQRAKAEAKRLGIATIDDIDSYVTQKITSLRQAEEILGTCKELEKEYSGEDGRPKFDTEKVLTHMQETGIKDAQRAYKDMYEAELDKWKEQQFAKARKTGIYTDEGSSGNHEPSDVKLTKDNLESALHDVLSPPDRL